MTHATQSAAIQAAQHFTGQFLPLEQVTRPNLKTEEAAFYLNRRPQTLRAWACLENGPIRPRRIGGLLAWATLEVKALAGVPNSQLGFSTLAYLACIIGAALLALLVSTGAFASLDWAGVAMLGAGVIGSRESKSAQLTGYCPLCDNDPAEILNVGRNHYAVCHECRVYWPLGSNLFSGWRDEEPEVWERNKKLLATYQNATDKPKTPRPPLGSLGDCLAETASYLPQAFTKITGCTKSFWRDIPADKPDAPWFVMEAATACLEPAPVTIYISAGTPAATARDILKQAAKWLKEHGDELPSLTPREPEPTAWDFDSVPF